MKTLKQAKVGGTVTVVKLHGEGAVKRRIMDMGITKGVTVYVRKVAPLGDPVEVNVRGYELSIRKAEIGSSSEEEAQSEMAEYADNLSKAADNGYKYHVVQPGETVYSLARRYGITEARFAELNDVSEGLKAGAMVRIPNPEAADVPQNDAAGPSKPCRPLPVPIDTSGSIGASL